jgi:hypothetical protein
MVHVMSVMEMESKLRGRETETAAPPAAVAIVALASGHFVI